MSEKAKEQRIRRRLAKQGMGLHKSRKRNIQDGYMVYDLETTGVLAGPNCDWSLDDIEEWLDEK